MPGDTRARPAGIRIAPFRNIGRRVRTGAHLLHATSADPAGSRVFSDCSASSSLPARYKASPRTLCLAGKELEAEQSLKTSLSLNAQFEPALYALGRIYYQMKRFPEAVQRFQEIIELDPKNYRAHDNLGLCYDALYRDADALRHFLKALDLVYKDHPEYDWAHANLAEFYLKRDQYEKAFQLAAEAAQRNRPVREGLPTGGRSGAAQSPVGAQLLSDRQGPGQPEQGRAELALAGTRRRIGSELPRGTLSARASLSEAGPQRGLRDGVCTLPGTVGEAGEPEMTPSVSVHWIPQRGECGPPPRSRSAARSLQAT